MKKMDMILLLLSALIAPSIAGCGTKFEFSLMPEASLFHQNTSGINQNVDILWVIDTSSSMDPLQTSLANNFASFIAAFRSKGYDFHIGVTTTDAYLAGPTFRNNLSYSRLRDGTDATSHTGIFVLTPTTPNIESIFLINTSLGTAGSGDERAFSSFKAALDNPQNSDFLRPQSFLAVIILSDEDDFSSSSRPEGGGTDHDYAYPQLDSVSSYVTYLDGVTQSTADKRRYNVSAITVLDAACLASHQVGSPSSIIGTRYLQLADATNGIKGSICDDFGGTLANISNRILELTTVFKLSRTPRPGTLSVVVNGVTVPQDSTQGWTYDAVTNSISFHGSFVPDEGADILIQFIPYEAK